jgi:hypothetical protein
MFLIVGRCITRGFLYFLLVELNYRDSERLVEERHTCAEQEPPTTIRGRILTVRYPLEDYVKK